MQRASRRMINALRPDLLEVAEISGKWGRGFGFKTYTQFRFPQYDICAGPFLDESGAPRQFDLILANQVWEHLDRPYRALGHVRQMLRDGGHFWIAVPFYIPFHAAPYDCSRWSARGLKNLLIEGGFDEDKIETYQWGNRNAARRNLELPWPPEVNAEDEDLTDEPDMPICSWGLARK